MAEEPVQPYRVVVQGTTQHVNCKFLLDAILEAVKLAERMNADVHIYQGLELLQTVKAPEK